MNVEALRLWFDVLQFLLTGGIGIYVYLSNKNRVTNERITSLELNAKGRLDDHAERLIKLETHVEHLPEQDDVAGVRELIGRVGGDVKGLSSEVRGLRELLQAMQTPVNTITEFLISQGK